MHGAARTPRRAPVSHTLASACRADHRYDLLQPAECLVGRVAIADGSSTSALPVVLEVRTDDNVVWTSPPMSKAGSSRFFRVFTDGAGSIELRARAVGAPGASGCVLALLWLCLLCVLCVLVNSPGLTYDARGLVACTGTPRRLLSCSRG